MQGFFTFVKDLHKGDPGLGRMKVDSDQPNLPSGCQKTVKCYEILENGKGRHRIWKDERRKDVMMPVARLGPVLNKLCSYENRIYKCNDESDPSHPLHGILQF